MKLSHEEWLKERGKRDWQRRQKYNWNRPATRAVDMQGVYRMVFFRWILLSGGRELLKEKTKRREIHVRYYANGEKPELYGQLGLG